MASSCDSLAPAGAEGQTPIEIRIAPQDFLIANEARRMGLGYEGKSPLSFWNRRDGESLGDYRQRLDERQIELFMAPGADPAAVAGGNHIVIRHPGDEYSFYGHLAYGSVRVKESQQVARGEHIAGVGGTGEVPAVHLHFQVSDSPSPTASRTFPIEFTNVHVNEQFVDAFEPRLVFQSGFFLTTDAAR